MATLRPPPLRAAAPARAATSRFSTSMTTLPHRHIHSHRRPTTTTTTATAVAITSATAARLSPGRPSTAAAAAAHHPRARSRRLGTRAAAAAADADTDEFPVAVRRAELSKMKMDQLKPMAKGSGLKAGAHSSTFQLHLSAFYG